MPTLKIKVKPKITRINPRKNSVVKKKSRRFVKNKLRKLKRELNNPKLSKTATSNRLGIGRPVPGGRNITTAGFNFLKCAFAPPDFSSTQVTGVPDEFRGMTLLKKHAFTTSLTVAPANDYYILLLPVPGVTMFMATVATGTPILAATQFIGDRKSVV